MRGACELLAVAKDDFEKVLESTIRKSWGQIEEYMGKFCYFDTWDTFSRQRLCMAANINDYKPDRIILGGGFGYPNNGYFVIKGKCLLISELKVVYRMGYKGPYAVRLYSKETGITENEMIKSIFIQSCTFLPGGLFGFGVDIEGRTIIAITNATCLTVPLDLLLQSKNTNYIWHRIVHYLEQNLPSKEVLFKCYLEQHNWLNYRSALIKEAFMGRPSPSTTSRSDVPYCSRLNDERRD